MIRPSPGDLLHRLAEARHRPMSSGEFALALAAFIIATQAEAGGLAHMLLLLALLWALAAGPGS